MRIGGDMFREVIYFCAELLNYWSMTFWGLKLFAKVYDIHVNENKIVENVLFALICLPIGILGAINYIIVVYSNFLTYVIFLYIWVVLRILSIKKKIIPISLVALYVFCVRLIDLGIVAVIEETNKVSRHLFFDLIHSGIERVCFIALLSFIYYIIFKICSKEKIVLYLESSKFYRRILFIYGYVGISGFSIVYRFNYREQMIGYWTFYLVCAFILIGTCLFYFIGVKGKEKERFLSMRNDMLEANYRGLQKVYEENSTLQHDYKNHLLAINELIKENKNEEALLYISNYIKYAKTTLNHVETGSEILNIIVNSKINEAREKNITFKYNIEFLNRLIMEDIDVCALMSNLLDNAIKECEYIEENKSWIYLKMARRNDMLLIEIGNSIRPEKHKKRQFFTTENSNSKEHGWGMKSIDRVISKYGGTKEYSIENNKIEFFIVLPIK